MANRKRGRGTMMREERARRSDGGGWRGVSEEETGTIGDDKGGVMAGRLQAG